MSATQAPELIETPSTERPEVELLLCCARTRLDAETRERIKALVRRDLNWDSVSSLAHRHGVFPLLYWQLNVVAPDEVPAEALGRLKSKFRDNAARNLLLTNELESIATLFEAEGVPVIAYKGPALAAMAYGDLSLRRYVDLDVVVRKADVPRAKTLLMGRGFIQPLSLSPAQERILLRAQHNLQFTREGGRLLVELHWEVASRQFASPQLEERVWERACGVRLRRREVRSLSPEDLLVSLCVHGARHIWERLSWICDVAELLNSQTLSDWDYVFDRARAERIERMLLLGLRLAGGLLQAGMPEGVRRRAFADPSVAALYEKVVARLFDADEYRPAGFAQTIGFNLGARERLPEKIRYFGFIFQPTDGDLAALNLPPGLSFAYYLLRPFRLLLKGDAGH